jgi:hypothetical protein
MTPAPIDTTVNPVNNVKPSAVDVSAAAVPAVAVPAVAEPSAGVCASCDWTINTLGYLICGNRLSAYYKRLVSPLHTCPQHEVLPDPYALMTMGMDGLQ